MQGTAGTCFTISSIAIEAGTWILCADGMFYSTIAAKTSGVCQFVISNQNTVIPTAEHGFCQTGIGMSMPTIGIYYKPGTITRLYQGAATTMYLICNLLYVTPVKFIKPFAMNYTATCNN